MVHERWFGPACLNCGTTLRGEYCHACGQTKRTERIGWGWLMHQLALGLFSLDHGIPFTLKQLFTRPGHAVREYLEGKRKPYFPPVTLLLILSGAGVVLSNSFQIEMSLVSFDDPGIKATVDGTKQWMLQNQSLIYLGMLPFMAVSGWLCMRHFGHGFIEHVLINVFISVQVAAVSPILFVFMAVPGAMYWVTILGNSAHIALFVWTYAQLYSKQSATQVSVRLLCTIGLLCFFLLIMMIVGVLYGVMLAARDSGRL